MFLHNNAQSRFTLCGEESFYRLSVRIIPAHRKYRRKRPVGSNGTAIYAAAGLPQPPDDRTYSAEVTGTAAISRIIACFEARAGADPQKLVYYTFFFLPCQEHF